MRVQCPFGHCCVEQRGQERGRPHEERRRNTPKRRDAGGGRGCNEGAPRERAGSSGRQAGRRPPRPARDSQRDWRPAQPFATSQLLYFYFFFPYYYFFPAQSGNPGLPKRAVQGPPFPGESAARVRPGRPGKGTGGECPAPNPPPCRPGLHGCRRPPAPRDPA